MKIGKLVLKITLLLAAFTLPPFWLVSTNTGLNTALTVASWFSPLKTTYGQAHGTILGQAITINNLKIVQDEHTLEIAEITLFQRTQTFIVKNIRGFEYFLPAQDYLAIDQQTIIDEIQGTFEFDLNALKFKQLNVTLLGKWQKAALAANIHASNTDTDWQIHYANIQIGDNNLEMKARPNTSYAWDLKLIQPQLIFKAGYGALLASGSINLSQVGAPEINGKINAKNFGLQDYAVKNLSATVKITQDYNAPLNLTASADKLVIQDQVITAIKINTQGTINHHVIKAAARYQKDLISISTNGSLNNNIWQGHNLNIIYQDETLVGDATFDIMQNTGELNLKGNPLLITTTIKLKALTNNSFSLDLAMHANAQNNLQGSVTLTDNKLDGNVNLKVEDLSLIMQYMPDVTRLKGLLKATANVSGTIDKPLLTLDAHLTDITATFPAYGIKIKPMELHISSNNAEKFVITGNGKMRRGTGEFTINGFIEPFKPNMPNLINVVGTEIEFINNEHAHLTAANNLKFNYDPANSTLNITGDIDIQKGDIHFDPKKSSTVKSKDVVFIGETSKDSKDDLIINPDINLRISEGVHFTGFGLDADITGKLDINRRHETMYGTGRVTIKQGTFQLPGQKLEIQKGRLLYPPGTVLANPSLDIKMMGKGHTTGKEQVTSSDLEIIVQGTAQSPIIRESGIGNDKDKAMSQALLAGTSVLSKNLLQDKFKLSELGIVSKDDHVDFFDDRGKNHASKNRDLVVGRPLGKNFYLQYLHSMNQGPNSEGKRARLKYALSKTWAVGVEAGDQGSGADLSFAFEKD